MAATKSKVSANGNGRLTRNTMRTGLEEALAEQAMKGPVQIRRLPREIIRVPIIGTSPLLMAKFTDKSKRQMLEAQMGKKHIKQPKNPRQLFEDAQYRLGKGWGMPAVCFKAAIVGAARFFDKTQLPMTLLKPALFIFGEGPENLIKLECNAPVMHEWPVRNASGVADLRYRPLFEKWGAILTIQYPPSVLSLDSVLALVDASGLGGVGDWRPSSPKCATGTFGTYIIDDRRKVEHVK